MSRFIAVWSQQAGEFRSYGTGHHRLHLQRASRRFWRASDLDLAECARAARRRTSQRLTSVVVRLQAMLWPPIPWPLPPVNGWNMVIDRYRGHTRVTVDAPLWKARAVSVCAYSSAVEGRPLIAKEWPDGLAGRIARRMADNHGGEKGRVLYIGRRTQAEERAPLAVAAWHLTDSGPLELLELDVAQAVRVERPDLVGPCGASLLALLRAIAAHAKLDRPDDRLAWITDDDEVARRAYEQWGFVGLKPSARPAVSTSRHYLRRIER